METIKPDPVRTRPGSQAGRSLSSRSLADLLATAVPPRAEEPPAPGPALRVRDAGGEPRTILLDRDETRLGRQTENDIQFLESHISKRHARIVREGGGFRIVDLGSKAGVYVNGERVQEQVLVDGDVITLGQSPIPTLIFSLSGSTTMISGHSKIMAALKASSGEETLDRLARFLEFNRLIGSRFTLREILDNVVDIAAELTDAERGFLILRDPDDRLDYRLARDRERRPIPLDGVRVSETIVREAMEKGATRVVNDVLEEEGLCGQESVLSLHLRSAIALPLRRFHLPEEDSLAVPGDEVFGVLYLDSRQAHGSFSKLDRGLLESLANNASSVIENARLHGEAEAKRQMDEEIARAREVQQTLLPREFRGENHFQIAGTCIPCRQLGGDYLDQFPLPDGETCVVIADVAGKGMSAALLAAALQGMLAAETSIPQPLGKLVERVNLSISRRAPEGKFVTLFCGVLHGDGDFRFVNAGHPPPLLVSGRRELRPLASGAIALGFRSSAEYRETRVRLVPGDLVIMYTDGITEAIGPEGEQFGEARLEDLARAHRDGTADEIRRAILAAVSAFCGERPAGDDLTLLVLKYTGTPSVPPGEGSGSWSAS